MCCIHYTSLIRMPHRLTYPAFLRALTSRFASMCVSDVVCEP